MIVRELMSTLAKLPPEFEVFLKLGLDASHAVDITLVAIDLVRKEDKMSLAEGAQDATGYVDCVVIAGDGR